MPQYAFWARTDPISPRCVLGETAQMAHRMFEPRLVPMTPCAPGSCPASPAVRLRAGKAKAPTTPTLISVLPIPMQSRVDIAIVARDSAKIGHQPRKTSQTQDQEEGCLFCSSRHDIGTFQNCAKACVTPKEKEDDRHGPEEKRPDVAPSARGYRSLCGISLAASPSDRSRVGKRSLLIQKRHRDNIRGPALIALIWVLLR
jgi:hypothetical protein